MPKMQSFHSLHNLHSLPHVPKLSRPVRRATLIVHVTGSVGWLGVSLCMLTLGIAAAVGGAGRAGASYASMALFADWLLVPLALLALASGLVLALGTAWGLARHRWVLVKAVLTLGAALLTVFSLRPGVHEAAERIATSDAVPVTDVIVPPAVSLGLYAFITAVSVLKPWGLTRRGQRLRSESAAERKGKRSDGPTTGVRTPVG